MPASKPEQVLEALKMLLETLPSATVDRNSVLPEKIPDGGLIILRDGSPGEPEQALGGLGSTYYQHAVEIEVYLEEGDGAARDAAFDALLQQIGAALETDPILGGLAFGRPEPAIAGRLSGRGLISVLADKWRSERESKSTHGGSRSCEVSGLYGNHWYDKTNACRGWGKEP